MQTISQDYKYTELGEIPIDWEIVKLGDIANCFSGGTPDTSKKEYYNGNIRWINSSELNKGRIFQTENFISVLGLNNSSSKLVEKETLLLAMYGATAGVSAITYVNGAINQAVLAIIPKSEIAISEYIFQYFNIFKYKIIAIYTQGGQPNLNGNIVKSIQIPLPPLTEQIRIATILSDMDAFLTATEKLLQKKKAIKQGLMQELLTPKEGWEVKELGSCIVKNPDYGINAAAVPFNDNLPAYLRITDIKEDGTYTKNNLVSVNNVFADSYVLQEGDLVFARTGASVGKTYLYNPNDGKLVFAGFLIRVKTNSEILNSSYLKYFTQTKKYKDWIIANSMRTGQPGINSNEYKKIKIPLPPLSEQTRIATILSDADAEIQALEAKLSKYRLLKQGMMHNLLTGKIRV